MEEFLRTYPGAADLIDAAPLRELAAALHRGSAAHGATRADAERWLSERILALRQADRDYWVPVMDELRGLHASGRLMPVGAAVRRPPGS
jgi:hypothetical protein